MATHQEYKKFAVKYNKEFKIAGVHKMKKEDLINSIEERLKKSRKEIRDEYKQLKNMIKEKNQVTKKEPVKKQVTKKEQVKKQVTKKEQVKKEEIEYNKITLQRMLPTLANIASQYKFTKAQLDKAYPLADKLLSSFQAKEWKELYEDKYKKPKLSPVKKSTSVKKSTPVKKERKKPTPVKKVPKKADKVRPNEKLKKEQQTSNTLIEVMKEPKTKKEIDFDPKNISIDKDEEQGDILKYETDDVAIWITKHPTFIDLDMFISNSKVRGIGRKHLCQFLNYINNKSKNKNKLKLKVNAVNIYDQFDSLNDLVNLFKKMSFKFKEPIQEEEEEASGETTIKDFLKFCESYKL